MMELINYCSTKLDILGIDIDIESIQSSADSLPMSIVDENNNINMHDKSSGANSNLYIDTNKLQEDDTTLHSKQQDLDNDEGVDCDSTNHIDQTKYLDPRLENKFSLSEVAMHSTLDDCWLIMFDKVYDVTEFVFEHPGGDFILLEYAGCDATQAFIASHGSSAYKMLDKYLIGTLNDEDLCYSNSSSYCSIYSSAC